MKTFLRLFLCFLFVVFLGVSATFAQFAKLDDLTADLAKKLKSQESHSIGVAEFTGSDGSPSEHGAYFAWFVSNSLSHHAKKVSVTKSFDFNTMLAKQGITPKDASSPDGLKRIADATHVDTLITGTIEAGSDSYTVRVTARKIAESSPVAEITTVMQRTEFTDSLSEIFPPKIDFPYVKYEEAAASNKKIKPPECIYCPQPDYNAAGRKEQIQGSSIFLVLISPQGEIVKAHPKKLLGSGLDEAALKSIMKWRMKPAIGPDGKPIGVIVDVEVTFHLY